MMSDLSSFIFLVRRQLNDVPEDYLTDENIYQALQQADAFLSQILSEDVDSTYRGHCLVALSSYIAYIVYVSTVERGLGGIPAGSTQRAEMLKKVALLLIKPVAKVRLNKDLEIDLFGTERPVVGELTSSVADGG